MSLNDKSSPPSEIEKSLTEKKLTHTEREKIRLKIVHQFRHHSRHVGFSPLLHLVVMYRLLEEA